LQLIYKSLWVLNGVGMRCSKSVERRYAAKPVPNKKAIRAFGWLLDSRNLKLLWTAGCGPHASPVLACMGRGTLSCRACCKNRVEQRASTVSKILFSSVILSEAPQGCVIFQDVRRVVEGPRECVTDKCRFKVFSPHIGSNTDEIGPLPSAVGLWLLFLILFLGGVASCQKLAASGRQTHF
jgi:hypothetical protein